jgi:NAD-dependent dihydropyrimidine dehydrogenase PreA subunit
VEIDPDVCTGCNTCVDVCFMDILVANEEEKKPPIVAYPEECWFDGCCVELCPQREKRAIRINTPASMRVSVLRGERPEDGEEHTGKGERP